MGVFERYTEAARRVVFFARYEAGRRGSNVISTPHFVLGLVREGSSPVLENLHFQERLNGHWQAFQLSPDLEIKDDRRDIPLDDDAKKALAYTTMEADRDDSRRIEPEHLLRGMLCFENAASGPLNAAGLDLEVVRTASKVITRQQRTWHRVRRFVLLLLRESIWPALWRVGTFFLALFMGVLLLRLLKIW